MVSTVIHSAEGDAPFLSILIPAFNAAAYLGNALDALIDQLPERSEIVVCDDGSNDDTAVVATAYAKVHPHVKLVRQANAGAAAARNAAFRASSGAHVCFFDADDLCAPGSLAAMLAVAVRHPLAVVHCAWSKFADDPSVTEAGPLLAEQALPGWQWLQRAFAQDYPTYPGSFLMPRALLDVAGLWDERLGFQDDMEFFARVISAAPEVCYCAEARFLYRAGVPGSLSKRGGRCSSESQWLATEQAVRHLLAAHEGLESRAAAARQLMLLAYAQYLWAPDISAKAEALALSLAPQGWHSPVLPGGPARRLLQDVLGWKAAIRMHARLRGWLR